MLAGANIQVYKSWILLSYFFFSLPRFENELSIVIAVHAEVEEDLPGARDEDRGADDAAVHPREEEQQHGKSWRSQNNSFQPKNYIKEV